MNEKILEKYQQYLRRESRKKITSYNYYIFTKLFLQWIDKSAYTLTKEDMLKDGRFFFILSCILGQVNLLMF